MNSTNEIKVGEMGIVKVGCNEINVEVIQILNNGLLVKNLKTGKTFRAAKLERLLEGNAETAFPVAASGGGPESTPEMGGSEPESSGDVEPNDDTDDIPAGDGNPDDDEQENPAPESRPSYTAPESTPKIPVPTAAPLKQPIKKISTLDEAVKYLQECGESKSCPELIMALTERGLCSLKGATPAQTLYSSFIREIRDRGDNSRMVRDTEQKGKFMIRPVAGGQDA